MGTWFKRPRPTPPWRTSGQTWPTTSEPSSTQLRAETTRLTISRPQTEAGRLQRDGDPDERSRAREPTAAAPHPPGDAAQHHRSTSAMQADSDRRHRVFAQIRENLSPIPTSPESSCRSMVSDGAGGRQDPATSSPARSSNEGQAPSPAPTIRCPRRGHQHPASGGSTTSLLGRRHQ